MDPGEKVLLRKMVKGKKKKTKPGFETKIVPQKRAFLLVKSL